RPRQTIHGVSFCSGVWEKIRPTDSRPSTHGGVAAGHAAFREDKLKQLEVAHAEGGGATQQVIPPHPAETIAVGGAKARPRRVEIPRPGHERPVVMRSEIVHVLDHEMA